MQFVLSVDVHRAAASQAPSRLLVELPRKAGAVVGEEDLSEPAQLEKISSLVISEWNQFVSREKRVGHSQPQHKQLLIPQQNNAGGCITCCWRDAGEGPHRGQGEQACQGGGRAQKLVHQAGVS